jgi:1-acyl-sn-glycerol-3-phosphate acyltransferase
MCPIGLFTRRWAAWSHRTLMHSWGWAVTRILGLEVEVRGEPPEPPYFLVCNHLSYVDVVVLSRLLGCSFLSKAEVADWPVMGFLARSAGTLFVDRTRRRDLVRVIEEVQGRLDRFRGVVVFPEGTSTKGASVGPFNPSIFEVPMRTGRPVHYASLCYSTPEASPPAHLAVCWWGDMPFFGHLWRLLTLPSIRATVVFGAQAIEAADRKSLAERAHRAVLEAFTPVDSCLAR